MRIILVLACLLSSLPNLATAQSRTTTGRARMELAFDHGYGASSEGHFAELATDLRVLSPEGIGAVVRLGLASNLFSNAFALDAGLVGRLDLHRGSLGGLQLAMAIGPSYARGPFDGQADALGGFALASLDLWHRSFFVGIGASGHLLAVVSGNANRADALLWTATPMLRVGGDWGL